MKNLKTKTLALISAIVCMSTIFSLFTVTVTAQDTPEDYYIVKFISTDPMAYQNSEKSDAWNDSNGFDLSVVYCDYGVKSQQTSHQGIVRFNASVEEVGNAVAIFNSMREDFTATIIGGRVHGRNGAIDYPETNAVPPVVEIVEVISTSKEYSENASTPGYIPGYFAIIFDGKDVDEFSKYITEEDENSRDYSQQIASWDFIDNPEIEDMTYDTPFYTYNMYFEPPFTEENIEKFVSHLQEYGEASYENSPKYPLPPLSLEDIYEDLYKDDNSTEQEYSDLMVDIIRKQTHLDYMSDLWFREVYFNRQYVSFGREFEISTKDYIFNSEDFPELNIYKVYQYNLTDYRLGFKNFDDAHYAQIALEEKMAEENSSIISVGYVEITSTDMAIFPTWDGVMKYMTPAEIEANREHFEGMSKNYTYDNFFNEIEYDENLDYDTNLTPLKADFIRERLEHKYNSFMPDEWFFENAKYCFRRFAGIVFEEGYEYNAEDFAEYGVVSIEENFDGYSIDDYKIVLDHNPTLKCIVFDSFESLTNSWDAINENPNVDWMYNNFSYDIAYELIYPTLEDVEKYLTPAEISENIEILEEMEDFFALDFVNDIEFEIDSELDSEINSDLPPATLYGDINNDNKVQMADIVVFCRAISAEDVTTVLTPQEIANADVYADGILDSADLSVFSSAMVNSKLSALPVKMSNE